MRNEIKYYEKISVFLKNGISNELSMLNKFVVDFKPCGAIDKIDFRDGLLKILEENSIKNEQLQAVAEAAKGLYVDILGLVYSIKKDVGRTIICEIKPSSLNLTDYSQLIGYCIASDTQYGLLIAINEGLTKGFRSILMRKPEILRIKRVIRGREIVHKIGTCSWLEKMRKIRFNKSAFKSLPHFSREIASDLEYNS
jgi:hypothetical protein